MSQIIVHAKHLYLSYKEVKAVQDVSFTIQSGEVLAVIGSNGSGKTSTIECVEGLRKPDSGSIQVFGKDPLLHRGEIYRKIGIQLQETEYPAKIRVEELCRLYAGFYERPADWKALMGRPKLLILDELTTGLDPEVRQNMWETFRTIRDNGVAILLVSHYLDEVEALADRMLYLEKGKQQFFGTQEEFCAWAKTRIAPENQQENDTLEKLYLKIVPKTTGITMEGIL